MIDLPNDVDHDNKQVYDIETEYIQFKFNHKTLNDVAGGQVIIGGCSQEFIVCALSMFQIRL